ncbi:hypothetical protein [Streptomyces sp. NPDC059455]|uniref:hypothetical protein n=1 Tax=Streptomyces sp. NPDC059455 TaxID=3346837 RepID=UPI0036C2426A
MTWLNWFASHWPTLSPATRSLSVAAAERPELQSIPSLRDYLVQHLLETDDTESWQYADALWNYSTTDQQASMLTYAHDRCPDLARCANGADADLLATGLVKADEHADDVLTLIKEAPEFDKAVMRYLDNRLEQAAWTPLLATAAIAEVSDPATLWAHVLPFMTEDQSNVTRAASYIGGVSNRRRIR